MSIRNQILLAVAGISLLTIVGFGAVVARRVQARTNLLAYEAAEENAALIALLAGRGLEKSGASLDTAVKRLGSTRWLAGLGPSNRVMRVQLFDATGALRFDSAASGEFQKAGAEVEAALSGDAVDGPVILADGLVAAAAPIRRELLGGEVLGAVRVIRPAVGVQEIVAGIAPEIAAVALLCMALVLAGAYFAGRSIGLPITRLTQAARKIAGGDRSLPFPAPRGLEVRALTESYEEMRRELEDKRHIERMTQDLSHELKNPIASVRALAEALEDGGLADAAAGPRLVKQIQGAATRLEAILADVLVLARLEARGLNPRRPVELRRLVAECVDGLAPRCAERKVEVKVEQAHGSVDTLEADAVWLARAVTNLLLNAIENSPPGSQVQVALSSAGPVRELVVSNPGEVPAAVKDRLFERFVTRRQEGTGLGLAISRSVADAHGGSLSLDQAGPPQVRVRLRLPARS